MFRKISAALAVIMLSALALTGCAGSVGSNGISGKGFVYEKDGFPDKFGIKLYDDGSFTYYVGMYSSHVGYGNWSLDRDTLILEENAYSSGNSKTFRFKVSGDTRSLSYIAEGSDSFMHVKVSDGEKFTMEELSGFPF